MTLFMTLFLVVAASFAAWWMVRARALRAAEPAAPADRPRPNRRTRTTKSEPTDSPAEKTAAFTALEWNTPGPPPLAPGIALDLKPARMRDRYIAARFPGVLRGSADLREIEYVIKVARHYFEEGRLDDAAELFALAIEQTPAERTLRLAQLEIAYLDRDAELFTRLARELHTQMPGLAEWDEVVRLGHAIAPGESLFASDDPALAAATYGPWPDMPNWIQASWDLTSEVLAADFHRAMAGHTTVQHDALRRVA